MPRRRLQQIACQPFPAFNEGRRGKCPAFFGSQSRFGGTSVDSPQLAAKRLIRYYAIAAQMWYATFRFAGEGTLYITYTACF
jgi:hypothetical protein